MRFSTDPHNATRGFFFSHIGWLLTKKHPDVMAKGKLISMKDVEEDPVVAWQTKDMKPVENIVIALLVLGEGWHNYHHVFPFDYKTSELGNYSFNNTNAVIDFFARIGWAYDLKTVSEEILRRRIQRTGDGTHKKYLQNPEENNEHHCNIWGWGDEDLAPEDRKDVTVIGRKLS
ncbi:Acyl-CoA Delta(11) desaturase [Blattella germanica]|nr:Acyl-CoA Delta(11) desaturase [Blattella germanica]